MFHKHPFLFSKFSTSNDTSQYPDLPSRWRVSYKASCLETSLPRAELSRKSQADLSRAGACWPTHNPRERCSRMYRKKKDQDRVFQASDPTQLYGSYRFTSWRIIVPRNHAKRQAHGHNRISVEAGTSKLHRTNISLAFWQMFKFIPIEVSRICHNVTCQVI